MINKKAPVGATHYYSLMYLKRGADGGWLYYCFEFKDWSPYPQYMPTDGIKPLAELKELP